MARTTITIDDALLQAAKAQAVREGITLSAVIERGLRHALPAAAGEPFRIRPLRGGRFQFEGELPGAGEMLALLDETPDDSTSARAG
jgi:Arc/MetJ family transcription regulator